jgi:hypothetical protein
MKPLSNRLIAGSSPCFFDSTIQRFNNLTILLFALLFPLAARAQISPPGNISISSISGQFIVTGPPQISPLAGSPRAAADPGLVRLEPALLAVSAERFKESLWRTVGIDPKTPWRGQIYLLLHPAQSLDENVNVLSRQSGGGWSYGVQLPDVVLQTRFARAMTGVLLLEFANRDAQSRSAEIPAWLADGLVQQLFPGGSPGFFLSVPDKIVNGMPVARTDTTRRGLDPLAGARLVLQNHPALTFEQLSWPTAAQLSGDDDGVYRASAQLFTSELLKLKNGPAHLRAMLASLPQYYNWQLAFQPAFRENFSGPLDVEKWWALQTVSFVARDPGPRWTPAVSRDKLDEILGVPVEMRDASNSLPYHAEVSLQAAINNFDPAQSAAILQTKLRDLELAQLRMAAPLAVLTDGYRRAIAGYLGQRDKSAPAPRAAKHPAPAPQKPSVSDTVKKLDALDEQRRTIEDSIKPDVLMPHNLHPTSP